MAHGALINSTKYGIAGGVTLVSGTSYSIQNGKVMIGGTAYDINFVLPPAVLSLWGGTNDDNNMVKCIAYANGYYVVGGGYYDGSTCYARIAYSTKLNGTWTHKDLWSSTDHEAYINCIIYASGYWVTGGYSRSSNTAYARIAYLNAANPGGTWTTKDVWSASYTAEITGIAHNGSYFVVGGCSYGSSNYTYKIAYGTSPASWTQTSLWTGADSKNELTGIFYLNGYFVVTCKRYTNSTNYGGIWYATDPSGTWTWKSIWSGSTSVIDCIAYANGYFVVGGQRYISSSSLGGSIAYATSLSGSWTSVNLWTCSYSSTISARIYSICYGNGYWLATGMYNPASSSYNTYVAYLNAANPGGTWTVKTDPYSAAKLNATNFAAAFLNGYLLLGGGYYNGSVYYGRLRYAVTPADLLSV